MLPDILREVTGEAYTALQHDLRFISAVGFRTALDIVTVQRIGDGGGFKCRIAELKKRGYITAAEASLIDTVVESGDAAAHRGHRPSTEDFVTLEKIVFRLLHKFYVKPDEDKQLQDDAQAVKSRVPSRPSKSAK